jgi:hypothetical protein
MTTRVIGGQQHVGRVNGDLARGQRRPEDVEEAQLTGPLHPPPGRRLGLVRLVTDRHGGRSVPVSRPLGRRVIRGERAGVERNHHPPELCHVSDHLLRLGRRLLGPVDREGLRHRLSKLGPRLTGGHAAIPPAPHSAFSGRATSARPRSCTAPGSSIHDAEPIRAPVSCVRSLSWGS